MPVPNSMESVKDSKSTVNEFCSKVKAIYAQQAAIAGHDPKMTKKVQNVEDVQNAKMSKMFKIPQKLRWVKVVLGDSAI